MSSLSRRASAVAHGFREKLQKEEASPSVRIDFDELNGLSSPFDWKQLAEVIWPELEISNEEMVFEGFYQKLSLSLEDSIYAILGSLDELFHGKPLSRLMEFPFRELENFLRDENHRPTWSEEELPRLRDFLRDEKILLGVQALLSQKGPEASESLFDSRELVKEVTFLKEWSAQLGSLKDPMNSFNPAKDLYLFDVNDQEIVFSLSPHKPLEASHKLLWEAIWGEFLRLQLSFSFALRGRKVVAEAGQMT